MFDPQNYAISAKLFVQLLGLIYFFAFGAFLFQIEGLFGKEGILPIHKFLSAMKIRLGRNKYHLIPSLFWINSSDLAIKGVVLLGTLISIALFFGFHPSLCLFLLYFLYLSIVSTGQDFLSFGWEMFLLELTAQGFFLSLTTEPNPFIWASLNFQLFRFHFQGGIVKLLSNDPNWRNLTAVAYHYQSQPLPNTMAWYVYKLPLNFQRASTLVMFIIELIVPFALIVGNQEVRLFVFFCFIFLQGSIYATGNFSFLNHLTAAFSIILVSDRYLELFFTKPEATQAPLLLNGIVSLAGIGFISLQAITLWNHLFPRIDLFSKILNWIQPFHLANRYGIFAVMTTTRYEVVIEGSEDGVEWKEYSFYYKPSELNRRPRRISPYQPRIDWQAWFLPFSDYSSEPWFQNFLQHLLKGTKPVINLLRKNPFHDKPPHYVRALLYEYEFSSYETRKKEGIWWVRKFVEPYSPTLALKT